MDVRVAVLIAAIAAAQERPQQPPTFATRVEAVLVDVVVRDKSGQAVPGLSVSDFVVKEDGKERPILSFAAFDESAARPGSVAERGSLQRRPPQVATVVLVDDGHLSPIQAAAIRPALKSIVPRLGDRSGAMSIVAPLSKVSVAGAMPGAAADLVAAVDRINGYRFEDHSSFPVLDSEAFAVAGGAARALNRLASRFVSLNPTLTIEAAGALAQTRSAEVAYEARTRREAFYRLAAVALDWLAGFDGRRSVLIVSGGFVREMNDLSYGSILTRSMRVNAPL